MISWSRKRISEVSQLYVLLLCFHDRHPPMILHRPFRRNGNAGRMTTLACVRTIASLVSSEDTWDFSARSQALPHSGYVCELYEDETLSGIIRMVFMRYLRSSWCLVLMEQRTADVFSNRLQCIELRNSLTGTRYGQ